MNDEQLLEKLETFMQRNRASLEQIILLRTQLLELAALVVTAEHYKRRGYAISPVNLVKQRFRVKRGSKGDSATFSWFSATCGASTVEIHANLPVRSDYGADGGIYVVDVGVTSGLPPNWWTLC